MTSPSQPGGGKLAGIILLGVAAVALVLGIVTLSGGGDQPQAASNNTGTSQTPTPGPGSSAPATPTTTGSASPSSGVPAPAPPTAPPGKTTKVIEPPAPGIPPGPAIPGPGGPGGGAPEPAGQPVSDKSVDVRIYNNGTIKHLAERAADRLRGDGYRVVSVANYPQGIIPTTTVYYRPGTPEQATAESVAGDIGARAQPRFAGLAGATPGVIVIVTNDYRG